MWKTDAWQPVWHEIEISRALILIKILHFNIKQNNILLKKERHLSAVEYEALMQIPRISALVASECGAITNE